MAHRTNSRALCAKPFLRRTDSVPPSTPAAAHHMEPGEDDPTGIGGPRPPARRSGAPARRRLPLDTNKASENTVVGCNARAAADLSRASTMDTLNGRRRLEASAASWSARAELLKQDADGFEAVRALAIAEWKAGEEAARHGQRDDDHPSRTRVPPASTP